MPSPPSTNSTTQTSWTLEQLTQSFGLNTLGRTHFKEQYYSSLLTTPVLKTGELRYAAPATFEKHILSPTKESFVVNEDTLVYENKDHGVSRTVSLEDYPPLLMLFVGLRSIFTGNIAELHQWYSTEMLGGPAEWILTIFPLDEENQKTLRFIRFSGSHNEMQTIEIYETTGDHSILNLSPLPQ